MHIYTYIHIYIHIYICVYIYICIYIYKNVYLYVYIYIHEYINMYIHICIYELVLTASSFRPPLLHAPCTHTQSPSTVNEGEFSSAEWHTLLEQVKILTADDISWETEEIFTEDMPHANLRAFKWGRKWLVPPLPPSLSRERSLLATYWSEST